MRVAFHTLGCKVNQFESSALAEEFISRGAEIVPFARQADLYVVNTCAVTAKAAYQSRHTIRKAKRTRPGARVIAAGCYVQTGAQEILDRIDGQMCLVGNAQKPELVDLALESENCLEVYIGDIARVADIAPFVVKRPLGRTRAFLKIQDGCNSFCSYCIVPYARGRSRSLAPPLVRRQVGIMEAEGVREVVLTGIHIGTYGADLTTSCSLLGLLKELCEAFPGLRFRLSSIEPTEVTSEILEWARKTPNFCPHWHIPLQSGSDHVLRRMNRHYSASLYRNLIHAIRAVMPDAAIGADILVGFPGEDESAFDETRKLTESLPLTYVHAFPFSKRPGTVAEAMKETATKQEKTKRVRTIRSLGEKKRRRFYRNSIGRTVTCLIEQKDRKSGLWRGLTENYVPVLIEDSSRLRGLSNRMATLRITRVDDGLVFGETVEPLR